VRAVDFKLHPPHISSPELDVVTILRPCYVRCTGFLSDESNTRPHVLFTSRLFTSRCEARHLSTWRMTSTTSPTVVVGGSDQLPSHDHTTVSETEASVLRACLYGICLRLLPIFVNWCILCGDP